MKETFVFFYNVILQSTAYSMKVYLVWHVGASVYSNQLSYVLL